MVFAATAPLEDLDREVAHDHLLGGDPWNQDANNITTIDSVGDDVHGTALG